MVRDRITSPVIPPLIPIVETTTASPDDRNTAHQGVTATFESSAEAEVGQSTSTMGPVKPSRSLLRALWGTATAPVKLVVSIDSTPHIDNMRFQVPSC